MKQTVVGVFDRYAQAQHAAQQLRESGFGDSVFVTEEYSASSSTSDSSASSGLTGGGQRDEGVMEKVKNFFSDLFGADDESEVSPYADAVGRGGAVVRVEVEEDVMADQARVALEAAGAINIDEEASGSSGTSSYGRDADMSTGAALGTGASLASGGTTLTAGAPMPMNESIGSRTGTTASTERAASSSDEVIPVVREQLQVGKRTVSTGGVRVYSRTIETPVQESIDLRTERAQVERVAVDRAVTPGDLDALTDRTIEVRETAEQAVVAKEARVVEEVRVGKTVEQHTEQINETVRNTEVEVEQLPAGSRAGSSSAMTGDDSGFRSHYASNFGSQGGSYDEYEPAYRYGNQMRGDSRYSSRNWDDVEPDLRRDWESSNSSGTWERFKAAVRHGWDRVTD